jgi:hypothetical protein
MKLYDRVDEDTEKKERNQPLCILLTVLLFMIIFLGLVMLSFNRSIPNKLELTAEDLETKLKLYETILNRLDKETNDNRNIYIPALLRKRYVVECKDFNVKANTSPEEIQKGKSPIDDKFNVYTHFKRFSDNLLSVDEVHMISFVNLKLKLPKNLKTFNDKYVDFGLRLEKEGANHIAKWKSNNVVEGTMQLCALVSGNNKKGNEKKN